MAREVGIKRLFGLDLPSWAVDPRCFIEDPVIPQDVFTLLPEDDIGLRQLFSLSSEVASLPTGTALTFSRLAASLRGLTAIVAGVHSQLSRLLRVCDRSRAESYLDMLSSAFGTEYLHVGIPISGGPARETARKLVQLATSRSLKIASGHTVRYLRTQDFDAHQTFITYK